MIFFPSTPQFVDEGKKSCIMENNICQFTNGTLVICHHFVDFVPIFVGVNFWCVYQVLQYALCPRRKAILVGEGVDHLVLFVHIHGSINLSKH